jgi:hypothetical protein
MINRETGSPSLKPGIQSINLINTVFFYSGASKIETGIPDFLTHPIGETDQVDIFKKDVPMHPQPNVAERKHSATFSCLLLLLTQTQ